MSISPEDLVKVGLDAKEPNWPKGTHKVTKQAFDAGKQAAADAILDFINKTSRMNMMFWEVRPKHFSPPSWLQDDDTSR